MLAASSETMGTEKVAIAEMSSVMMPTDRSHTNSYRRLVICSLVTIHSYRRYYGYHLFASDILSLFSALDYTIPQSN